MNTTKLRKLLGAALLLGVLGLTGCGGGGAGTTSSSTTTTGSSGTTATATALYTTAPSAVTIATGGTAAYTIAGGTAPYSASSSNPGVVAVSVSSSTMNITGIAAGTANIVVYDATGVSVTIIVTVANSAGAPLYTTAPLAITIAAIGGAQTYVIGGGTAPYTVTSDNTNVAKASVAGTSMTITGVADGKANILVRDATGTASVTIAVNVATGTGFTVIGSSSSWAISGGGLPCNTTNPSPYSVYFINGGVAPYTVSSTLPQVGTIIGVGTAAAPLPTPTGAKSVSLASWTVASGGYFVVAWPNANNNCASGVASFNVLDSTGLLPASTPTFTVTYTP